MAFDFDQALAEALQAGLKAAEPGGKVAQAWIRDSARANGDTLAAIAEGVARQQISKETAEMLLRENARALRSEAAALAVMIKAAAQAAANAFVDSLFAALRTALKLAL